MNQKTVEKMADTVDVPGDLVATKLPSSLYLVGMVGAVAASIVFFVKNKTDTALFVGLWAPTLLQFGIYNKLLRISRGTAQVTN